MTEDVCEKLISTNKMECTGRRFCLIFTEFCQETGSIEGKKKSCFNTAKPTHHSFFASTIESRSGKGGQLGRLKDTAISHLIGAITVVPA